MNKHLKPATVVTDPVNWFHITTVALLFWVFGFTVAMNIRWPDPDPEPVKPVAVPIVAVPTESQCMAWFFDSDLKAAKARICGRPSTKLKD